MFIVHYPRKSPTRKRLTLLRGLARTGNTKWPSISFPGRLPPTVQRIGTPWMAAELPLCLRSTRRAKPSLGVFWRSGKPGKKVFRFKWMSLESSFVMNDEKMKVIWNTAGAGGGIGQWIGVGGPGLSTDCWESSWPGEFERYWTLKVKPYKIQVFLKSFLTTPWPWHQTRWTL